MVQLNTAIRASGTSEVSICNKALRYLGAQEINSLQQESREADLCAQGYIEARNEMLMAHNWSFATRYASLALVSKGIEQDTKANSSAKTAPFLHMYKLPIDCLAVQKLVNDEPFVIIENGILCCNCKPATAVMTVSVTDPEKYSSLFIEALARRLAASLCVSLINNARLEQVMMQRFASTFEAACLADAVQQSEGVVNEFADAWLAVR